MLGRKKQLRADPDKVRAWQQRTRKRLPAQSKKRAATVDDRRAVREIVYARDNWTCRLAGRVGDLIVPINPRGEQIGCEVALPPCGGPLTPHHLQKASDLGPYTVDNLMTLCARHNSWVEDVPWAALALNLVRRSHR